MQKYALGYYTFGYHFMVSFIIIFNYGIFQV